MLGTGYFHCIVYVILSACVSYVFKKKKKNQYGPGKRFMNLNEEKTITYKLQMKPL